MCMAGKEIDRMSTEHPPCTPCEAGFAAPNGTCAQCPSGTQADESRVQCLLCAENEVSFSGVECTTCSPGSSPNVEVPGCVNCPPDQSVCRTCTVDTYSGDGSTCKPCYEYSSSEAGATSCDCWAGFNMSASAEELVTGDYRYTTPCADIDECETLFVDGAYLEITNETFFDVTQDRYVLCDPLAGGIHGACSNYAGGYNCSACPPGFDGTGYPPGCSMPWVDPSLGQSESIPSTSLELVASAEVLTPGPEQDAFMNTVINDLANSLGLNPADIVISNVRAPDSSAGRRQLGDLVAVVERRQLQDNTSAPAGGAVSVEFDFVVDAPGVDTADLMRDLTEQLADPESPLMNGAATSALNPDQVPTAELVCPAGYYRNTAAGSAVCEMCIGGFEPNEDQDGCSNCILRGNEYMSNGLECSLCPPGEYPVEDDLGHKSGCGACQTGKYSPGGMDRCESCPMNQQPNLERSACKCDTGDHLQNFPCSCLSCVCSCLFVLFVALPHINTNLNSCTSAGKYNATWGYIYCYDAASAYDPADFGTHQYDEFGLSSTGDTCLPCDVSCLNCNTGIPLVKDGYALSVWKSEDHGFGRALEKVRGHRAVYACPLGNTSCVGETQGQVYPDTDWQCSGAYAGPLCQNCADGYARKGLDRPCFLCEDEGLGWPFYVLVFVAILCAAGFIIGIYLLSRGASGDAEQGGIAGFAHRIMSLGKILVGLFQVLSQLEFTLEIKFPLSFKWIIEFMRIFSLDLLEWFDIGCM